jgi:RND family efflux transporter MFP subunit
MIQYPIVLRSLISAALVALISCGRGTTPGTVAAANAASTAKPAATGEGTLVVQQPLDAVVRLQGELAPLVGVDVYARVSGYVRDIEVDRGSTVHRGDVIAHLDAPELLQQRAEAEAKLIASRQTVERLRGASRTAGAIAGHEVELADAALHADSARVAALRDMESYLTVRAPFDGAITDRRVHPGALVGPSQGSGGFIVRLEDHANLRLTVAVPEQMAGSIQRGKDVGFVVTAWPGRTFHGRVARVAGALDPRTRTMPVELDVVAGNALSPGMYADVAWPASRSTPSLFVPPTAIVQTTARTYVIRVRGGKADLVNVTRGVSTPTLVEVFGSLTPGDTLMRRGADDVAAGDAVVLTVAAPARATAARGAGRH